MNLVDFDTGMKVLDAITTATPTQKRLLVSIDDAAKGDPDGSSWIDADTVSRGEAAALRALARRGLISPARRGYALTEAGGLLLAAIREDADALADAHAADRLERRRSR